MTDRVETFREGLLLGKSAFITGGTSGINLAIAKRLVRAGASVTVLGRDPAKAEAAAKELQSLCAAGQRVRSTTADVRDYAALEARIKEHVADLGPIDVLVCGAAGNFPAPAMGMSANGFKAVVEIDLMGTFNAARAAFEHLRKPGASVINVSAPQAYMPTPLQVHVCAAKSGVDMITKVLAIEWGGAGVRINSLTPGPVDDTEGMRRLAPTPEAKANAEAAVPLGRFAHADELADAALFLCSPAASYVHGAVFVVDGGWSLKGSGSLGG
jgi:NAD(P)-dependent dehydrogenase (short-subunit alcohol dehydrogenase family)